MMLLPSLMRFVPTLYMNEDDILVSYDVTALFTNVPLDETIKILVFPV